MYLWPKIDRNGALKIIGNIRKAIKNATYGAMEHGHLKRKQEFSIQLLKTCLLYVAENWTIYRKIMKMKSMEIVFRRRSPRRRRSWERKDRWSKAGEHWKFSEEEIEIVWYGHLRRLAPTRWPNKIYVWVPPGRKNERKTGIDVGRWNPGRRWRVAAWWIGTDREKYS